MENDNTSGEEFPQPERAACGCEMGSEGEPKSECDRVKWLNERLTRATPPERVVIEHALIDHECVAFYGAEGQEELSTGDVDALLLRVREASLTEEDAAGIFGSEMFALRFGGTLQGEARGQDLKALVFDVRSFGNEAR